MPNMGVTHVSQLLYVLEIVVVDMDDRDSIGMAGTWKQDIVNNAVITGSDGSITDADPKSIPILLVGNKTDKVKRSLLDDYCLTIRS